LIKREVQEMTMEKGKQGLLVAALVAASAFAPAFAQTQGCIVMKTVAEVEQEATDANGQKTKKLVPVATGVPGTEVIYTLTANNNCKQAAENIAINDPLPAEMSYVANSAVGPGSDISFSIDGKTFAKVGDLKVSENGAARAARPDEVRFIRWTFASLAPGAQALARFRAVVK
jgi:uncharacterized repeat protein (TIGR01451 family)